MAAPVYSSDLTDILVEMSSTSGWTALGGGAAGLAAPETDFFIQGANCISKAGWGSAVKGMIYNNGTGITVASGKAVFMWIYYWAPNSLEVENGAPGGLQLLIGSASSAYKAWDIRGKDTLVYGGWVCGVVDPTITADDTTGSPSATLQYFGSTANVPAGGPSKGQPLGIDAFRHGRDFTCTNGESGNFATFAGAATYNDDVSRRYGQFQGIDGGYLMQGRFLMGSAGTAVDFRDSNKTILIARTPKVSSEFNTFEVVNASSNIDWTAIAISPLGTNARGRFVVTDNATIAIKSCVFTDMSIFTFKPASTITSSVFRRCGLVTQGTAVFSDCLFDSTNASTAAILCDNPSKISGTKFISSGTKHAIELTSAAAGGSFGFSGNTFVGYAATDGNTGNEVLYNNSGGAVTINASNITGAISVRNGSGASTTIVNAVTVRVTCFDAKTLSPISSGVRVILTANSGGSLPYQVTVTITRAASVATVAHTAHGRKVGDKILIKGANEKEYNGVRTITAITVNTYDYTVSGSPDTPATGTIKATMVVLDGTTNESGVIEDDGFDYPGTQPLTGRARRMTAAPLYKNSPIVGTITNAGAEISAFMVSDE
jgi:hypothetical protein